MRHYTSVARGALIKVSSCTAFSTVVLILYVFGRIILRSASITAATMITPTPSCGSDGLKGGLDIINVRLANRNVIRNGSPGTGTGRRVLQDTGWSKTNRSRNVIGWASLEMHSSLLEAPVCWTKLSSVHNLA